MLGELSWKHKTDRSLDLAGGECLLARVAGETDGLRRNALEGVVDERVHDGHGFATDASVWVDLLENLVDVRGKGFGSSLSALGTSGLRLS